MKWEPALAMVALLVLGLWVVLGPVESIHGIRTREGATTQRVLIGQQRGVLESTPSGGTALNVDAGNTTGHVHRILLRDGWASPDMTDAQLLERFGPAIAERAAGKGDNVVFRALNITSWASLLWVAIGFGGQLAFSGRTLIQWVVSEKQKQSVVPTLFWWLSLGGGVALFAYFAWRQDLVGVLGQSSGVVIYARNLKLIYKKRRRDARQAVGQTPAATG
ncbi:MAG: lipid-A-disaccharide synthase N-terminal domain-containing protein [Planctomycetota bacterium]|nr:lipid-A-disaccharide synthase N-terminal domain-containing protein [Planctomycetota bacterium]